MGVQVRLDGSQHVIRIVQNFIIPESQNAPSKPLQKDITLSIMQVVRPVLRPIGFDCESGSQTREIDDIRWNGMLAAETPASKLRVMQNPPQLTLRFRRLSA